jgi:hypothetical protein
MGSDFVMDIARHFLKHKKGSAGEYGHPKGLLSVIGAAVRLLHPSSSLTE